MQEAPRETGAPFCVSGRRAPQLGPILPFACGSRLAWCRDRREGPPKPRRSRVPPFILPMRRHGKTRRWPGRDERQFLSQHRHLDRPAPLALSRAFGLRWRVVMLTGCGPPAPSRVSAAWRSTARCCMLASTDAATALRLVRPGPLSCSHRQPRPAPQAPSYSRALNSRQGAGLFRRARTQALLITNSFKECSFHTRHILADIFRLACKLPRSAPHSATSLYGRTDYPGCLPSSNYDRLR